MAGCAIYSINNENVFVKSKVYAIFLPLSQCLSEIFIRMFYFISESALIPLQELLLHPLFGRILPALKSHNKFIIGIILHIIISRLVVLL